MACTPPTVSHVEETLSAFVKEKVVEEARDVTTRLTTKPKGRVHDAKRFRDNRDQDNSPADDTQSLRFFRSNVTQDADISTPTYISAPAAPPHSAHTILHTNGRGHAPNPVTSMTPPISTEVNPKQPYQY